MTKEKAMELLVAISQVEGYMIGVTGLGRPAIVFDNIDKIAEELIKIVRAEKL